MAYYERLSVTDRIFLEMESHVIGLKLILSIFFKLIAFSYSSIHYF